VPELSQTPRPLVVGLGNDDRSDDGIGLDVARALRRRPGVPADVVEGPGDLTRLLDDFAERERVILVDAIRSGAPPGTVHRWSRDEAAGLPAGTAISTHGFDVPSLLRLAVGLGRIPRDLTLFGIEALETGPGRTRTEPVRAAVAVVCDRIQAELGAPVQARRASPPREKRHA
jgi:hydrogenase maturation protease